MTNDLSILAERVRAMLAPLAITERRMFGGITFMLNGNMLCCASQKGLMVRVGKTAEPTALANPHAQPCLGAGRPMAGFIMIEPKGFAQDRELRDWLALAKDYVHALPAKPEKSRDKTSPIKLRKSPVSAGKRKRK